MQVADKWEGRMPGQTGGEIDWERRARRAEAEREAARAVTYASLLSSDARALELERAIQAAEASISWRATAPLRLINKWRNQPPWRRASRPAPS
jgi:hypothetical protein